MSFAAVSWAYKDTITSAKLAQMVENGRVHDHVTTDQGQRLGWLGTGTANGTTTTTATTGGTYYAISATVTIPSGLTAGRRIFVIATARLQTSLANANPIGQIYRGSTPLGASGYALPSPVAGQPYGYAIHTSEAAPAAGSVTYQLSVWASAAATITVAAPVLDVFLL
jgi:hypothetical protein